MFGFLFQIRKGQFFFLSCYLHAIWIVFSNMKCFSTQRMKLIWYDYQGTSREVWTFCMSWLIVSHCNVLSQSEPIIFSVYCSKLVCMMWHSIDHRLKGIASHSCIVYPVCWAWAGDDKVPEGGVPKIIPSRLSRIHPLGSCFVLRLHL